MKWYYVIFVLLVAALLTGCGASANEMVGTTGPGQEVAGFGFGIWHGLISPIAFLVSLFEPDVGIYEIHNNGNWYNLGFVIGASGASSGLSYVSSNRRRVEK